MSWLDETVLNSWHAARRITPDGRLLYSDLAMELVLTLRLVFRLDLCQAEVFGRSVLRLLGRKLAMPNHTAVSRPSRAFANHQPALMTRAISCS